MVRFDSDLDHVLCIAPVILLNVDSYRELQTIEVSKTLNASGCSSLRAVVLWLYAMCAIECCTNKGSAHLTPGRAFG